MFAVAAGWESGNLRGLQDFQTSGKVSSFDFSTEWLFQPVVMPMPAKGRNTVFPCLKLPRQFEPFCSQGHDRHIAMASPR